MLNKCIITTLCFGTYMCPEQIRDIFNPSVGFKAYSDNNKKVECRNRKKFIILLQGYLKLPVVVLNTARSFGTFNRKKPASSGETSSLLEV